MFYFKTCPLYGTNLDFGERCDCYRKETAPRAANSEGCQVESELQLPFSTSNYKVKYGGMQV